MPDVATIQATIRARLVELEEQIDLLRVEAEQLAAILGMYQPDAAKPRRPGRAVGREGSASKARARSSRVSTGAPSPKRGRPIGSGTRAKQALAAIGERPGITASELATLMGIGPNYLYRVLPRLEKEGALTKRGKGYHLTGELD